MPKEDAKVRYGVATAPNVARDYSGEGGLWACEACNETLMLSRGTKQWTCAKCIRVMYTTPEAECPLERIRRAVVKAANKT